MLAVTNLFGVAVFPLIPEYAIKVFDRGGLGFGLMTGLIGGGFAFGTAIVAIFGLPRRTPPIVIVCSLVWSAGSVAFAYSPNLPITLAILFLMGTASIIWGNALLKLIQIHAPYTGRVRIMNLYTITMGTIPFG